MKSSDKLKSLVKKKYGEIARQKSDSNSSCNPKNCCSDPGYVVLSDDYNKLDGYNRDADLGLGCGIPTEYAKIKEGEVVIDLGSGAGNDVFIARRLVGDTGKVIGIDMTEDMIEKARNNNTRMGYTNIEFYQGDIENIPVANNTADLVISNCVLNLVPNKLQAFREIFRILKPGGRFTISDILLSGDLPASLKSAAEMYVGCVAGAIKKEDYLKIINDSGFTNIKIVKEKAIPLPDNVLNKYLKKKDLKTFKESVNTILSVTIIGRKP